VVASPGQVFPTSQSADQPEADLAGLYSAVDVMNAEELDRLAAYIRSKRWPKAVGPHGVVVNSPRLTMADRKSILYMSAYAHPKASRDELAAIFGVSRQRVSQIVGAVGNSQRDKDLLSQFARMKPPELRDHWRVETDVERLRDFREGRIAATPVAPRHMTPPAIGRWSAYGGLFAVYERDGLFYFLIDAPDEQESNPRASAQQALDDCFAACRQNAWANSSGDPNEWFATYKEDPFGPANKSHLVRVGE
jgi:hypothetical protein